MIRRTALRRRTRLKSAAGLLRRSRLQPVSAKKREQRVVLAAAAAEQGAAFRAAIVGEACVVCGRSEAEAFADTGYGHQAHHGVPRSVLRRLGLHALLWDPGNAVCACEEPCHRRHTSRRRRIRMDELPVRVLAFAARYRLEAELSKEYPE